MTKSNSISTFGVIEKSDLLTEAFRTKMNERFHYYYPIERSVDMPFEEKCKHMLNWTIESEKAMIEEAFTRDTFVSITKENPTFLRDDCESFFNLLNENLIPTLIFSAGVGDVITEILRANGNGQIQSNIHVVSNFIRWTEEGTAASK